MIWYGMLRYDMTWYGMSRRAVAGMSCYWEAKDPLEGLCRLLMCPTMQCDASNMPNYALHFYNMPNSWNRILASTSSISRRRAVVSAVQWCEDCCDSQRWAGCRLLECYVGTSIESSLSLPIEPRRSSIVMSPFLRILLLCL